MSPVTAASYPSPVALWIDKTIDRRPSAPVRSTAGSETRRIRLGVRSDLARKVEIRWTSFIILRVLEARGRDDPFDMR
jgi:hypothetical protein